MLPEPETEFVELKYRLSFVKSLPLQPYLRSLRNSERNSYGVDQMYRMWRNGIRFRIGMPSLRRTYYKM